MGVEEGDWTLGAVRSGDDTCSENSRLVTGCMLGDTAAQCTPKGVGMAFQTSYFTQSAI